MLTRLRHPLVIATLALIALKIWLVAAQPVVAHANASFDDRLFLALAEQIIHGHWLGPYSQFTLMKGSMYPLFIAGAYFLHVPLPLAQHFLYLIGCAALVLALRPVFSAPWQPFVLFILLWWQPMSYVELDILRQNIYTPLTLLVFAGLFALQTRRKTKTHVRFFWGALLGISAGAFYLTREEGVWIVPGAALLIAWAVWSSWRDKDGIRPLLVPISTAVVCAGGIVAAVCLLNAHYYGWFGTVELRAREFVAAYGALQRPVPSENIPYVPVTRDVRLKLYRVSPSFAELQPCLEGPVGLEWASYSDYLTGRKGEELQIGGGSFLWALRDCVVESGHAQSAKDALRFYRSIADEVNNAADHGEISPVRARHDSMIPRWRRGDLRRLFQEAPRYSAEFLLFRGFTAYSTDSWGDADLLKLFRDLTRWELAHSNEALELDRPQSPLDRFRLAMLQVLGTLFRWLSVIVALSGIGAWLWQLRTLLQKRALGYLMIVTTVVLGSAIAVLLVNLVVDALAFRNQGPTALHQGYPLLILFGVTAWLSVFQDRQSH
jgi:hypothetical protein